MTKQKLAWLLFVVITSLLFIPTALILNLIVGFLRVIFLKDHCSSELRDSIRYEWETHVAAWGNLTK